jgi:hypothetical protein
MWCYDVSLFEQVWAFHAAVLVGALWSMAVLAGLASAVVVG